MPFVPGVSQNPFSRTVPQLSNSLQLPPQSERSQNATSLVAKRQLVPFAAMHCPFPDWTVQDPLQMVPDLWVQKVTVTELSRLPSVLNGSPMIVMLDGSWLSTHAFISARETIPLAVFYKKYLSIIVSSILRVPDVPPVPVLRQRKAPALGWSMRLRSEVHGMKCCRIELFYEVFIPFTLTEAGLFLIPVSISKENKRYQQNYEDDQC